jgi:hypothetical protein
MTTEQNSKSFGCSLLKGVATIVYTYKIHYSSQRGVRAEDKRIPSEINCKNANDCGVLDNKGNYNWAKCVQPDLKK